MKVDLERFTKPCPCGHEHKITVKGVWIEPGAVNRLDELLAGYAHPVILCDGNTKKAAEKSMRKYFETLEVLEVTGEDIHANDIYVDQVQAALTGEADILIAVGSGTIHDLTRYVAYQRGLNFISVPTAASVDGFVSSVAAMTWHGMKKTLTAVAPMCVLADTDIFSGAPFRLTASGISDLMGKYTALLDWKVCHIVTGEYFCETVYELELEAVKEVESLLDQIRTGEPECMEKLMYALILSGLAMQMIGNSRPASGAEHHVSHLWEMEIINDYIDALHGEKVSIGLILCLEYYEKIREAIERGTCRIVDGRAYETELLEQTFGARGKYQDALEENDPNIMADLDLADLERKLPLIAEELAKLPGSQDMEKLLSDAGCVTRMEELKIPQDLKDLTLRLCPYVRRRLTLLRLSKNFVFPGCLGK
ncbi:MAG: sn-glycerol-1-phosphate dehydrogenase [Lachnospiraceae bacterium]|nr:sn-glycerol-1-phosphate dehydrogenase [Lachnospiraceae bacterium]